MTNVDKLIGQNLKVFRKRALVSQEELAKKLGLHQAALSRIESGTQKLTPTQIVTAAKFFQLPTLDAMLLWKWKYDKGVTSAKPVIRVRKKL